MCCCCGELYAHRLWVFLILPVEDFCFKRCLLINPAHTVLFLSLSQSLVFFPLPPALFVCSKLLWTSVKASFQSRWSRRFTPRLSVCPARSPLQLSAPWKPTSCFTIWQGKVCRPSTISRGSRACTSPVWWLYRSYWPTTQTTAWSRFT